MKISNVLKCSFPTWYNDFKNVTADSIIIALPDTFLTYLQTDGLVLPESSTHGLYTKSDNMAMDGDDDDKDIRDDELMNMYEADWSTPSSAKSAESPEFGDFDEKVTEAIKSLGSRVFPKLNWSSPKDASWISFDKTLMCTCPSDIYLLLKSSEFIAHDLDQPFSGCEDFDEKEPPTVSYSLVLRKWQPPDPSTEFRCFVYDKKLIAMCQRNSTKFYRHLLQEKDAIRDDIVKFFNEKISPKFPDSCYVFDAVRSKQGKVDLVDFNPYGPVTDGLLYTWEELEKLTGETSEGPLFCCVETEEGVQIGAYANYAISRDIQDLTAGEDPYKFIDLMKLEIQKQDESSSEDEPEDFEKEKERKTASNLGNDKDSAGSAVR